MIMISRKVVGFIFVLLPVINGSIAKANATDDVAGISRRFGEYIQASRYDAALIEARKMETFMRVHVGTNSFGYAAAIRCR
jgi:hypothetical protein